jgi:hypothetical protein
MYTAQQIHDIQLAENTSANFKLQIFTVAFAATVTKMMRCKLVAAAARPDAIGPADSRSKDLIQIALIRGETHQACPFLQFRNFLILV